MWHRIELLFQDEAQQKDHGHCSGWDHAQTTAPEPTASSAKHGMVLGAFRAERLESFQQKQPTMYSRAVFCHQPYIHILFHCFNAVKDGILSRFINSSILYSTKSPLYDFRYIPYSRHCNKTRLQLQDK